MLLLIGEEKLLLSKDLYTEFYLYEGKELSEEEYRKIKKGLQNDALYAYGKRLLMRGRYSESECRKKLYEKDGEHAKAVFLRLKEEGFFDDRALALDYKEMKEAEGYGEKRIKEELLHKKGIAPEIIASLRFEEGGAKRLLPALEKRYHDEPLPQKKTHIERALLYRGFPSNEIKPLLRGLEGPGREKEEEALKKELESVYRRYKTRYNGKELSRRLYLALLRKGFKAEMIDETLKEKIHEPD